MAFNQFPNRRRVIQACVNCRMRKTRCDAAQPRCGLCTSQNVDCVYRDAKQPKIDYNTQVLLERIQAMEDRILSSASSSQHYTGTLRSSPANSQGPPEHVRRKSDVLPDSNTATHEPVFEVQIPLSHTANANHVFSWPLVQELLSKASEDRESLQTHTNATEVFFQPQSSYYLAPTVSQPPLSWRLYDYAEPFFSSSDEFVSQLRDLIHSYFAEVNIFFPLLLKGDILDIFERVTATEVCGREQSSSIDMPQYGLLLVILCLALLSSSGRSNVHLEKSPADHDASSESAIRMERLRSNLWDKSRLILGYISADMSMAAAQSSMLASVFYDDKERFRTRQSNYASWLLRIAEDLYSHHSAIYHNLPEFLLTNSSQDVSMTGIDSSSPASLQSPTTRIQGIPTGNNSWNVLRLKGRYYAGQYIIHRPFIEFIILNIDNFEYHPHKEAVLKRSKTCLDGCAGFIKVFDVETANSLTCLFPTGMVTFTMTIILMVATTIPVFCDLLPEDVEEIIVTGKRNLVRFSRNVAEFKWHLTVLEYLDVARRCRIAGDDA
ncbi:Zn2-C6 fungal-type domain-containing protein [Fusarium acuminatum]|uniref:Zn2-C6 fungal-type domain-containing protein n=1 Tax=Fusarium acuminatum TaxID=5515 RepID=A0ABZ2X788_9HYPO